ncbi:MAG: SDR family oxidoreductase [Hydrogenophilaceae bacterium]|jgi:NAD(P)-dependent dehydrogenase (short-subunit alcohol dehydrogenase family)|nr:SDR family oxidoreductase [Hydrogenophilaceae bacterium]
MSYKPFDLTGKVALVTGGNRGIGYGMAEALGQSGAAIAIWGRGAERNEEAIAKLTAQGIKAKGYVVDVADEAAVIAATAQTVADFGRLDTVIANAGIGGGAPSFAEFPTEQWRRVLAVDLDGVFWTFREACKHIVARAKAGDPGGSLIAISSVSAIHGAPRNQAYASAKGALTAMTKGIAMEYARYGVRANTILPGWVHTELAGPALDSKGFQEKVLPRMPVRRWGDPADFGGIAVYLASDASAFHTADLIVIDGGYTAF